VQPSLKSFQQHRVKVSRFRSYQVPQLRDFPFKCLSTFPGQGEVSAAWIVKAVDIFERGDLDVSAGLAISAPERFGPGRLEMP
jgi:hypothetical protein